MNLEAKNFYIGTVFVLLALAFLTVLPAFLQFFALSGYIKFTNYFLWLFIILSFVFYFLSPSFLKSQFQVVGSAIIFFSLFSVGVSLYLLGVIYLKAILTLLLGIFFIFIIK